jgi:hypothetical protein
MTQEPHTCPIRTIHHVLACSTSTDGHWWLSSGADTIAEDSCLLYAGPARGAAAVRDRRAWTQRRRIRLRLALPTRARLRHASTPEHLLCAYGGLRPNGMAGFSAARPTVVRVVVRRLGPTTGARAPVARVPASLSPALGSALSMPAATGDTGLHARAFDRRLLSCAPTLPGARPTHLTPCRACI